MAWADRFRWSTEVQSDPGSLVSTVGVRQPPRLLRRGCGRPVSLIYPGATVQAVARPGFVLLSLLAGRLVHLRHVLGPRQRLAELLLREQFKPTSDAARSPVRGHVPMFGLAGADVSGPT